MDVQQVYAERIKALRGKYLETLAERRGRLSAVLENLKAGGTDTEMLTQARFDIHKIAGTAGSFSFDHLGDLARRANELIDSSGVAPGETIQAIEHLLAELDRVIADH